MAVKMVCERCDRVMAVIGFKELRDWTKGEVCDVCLGKDAELFAFAEKLKGKYIRKMELEFGKFSNDLEKMVKKLAQEVVDSKDKE